MDSLAVGANQGDGSPSEGDMKRSKRTCQAKTFKVEISYAARIPMRSIAEAIRGREVEHTQDALRVLDTILRQHRAKRGCLLVRQSFFNGDLKNYVDLGGGVTSCRGFHSSFRTTDGGLSLNMGMNRTAHLKEDRESPGSKRNGAHSRPNDRNGSGSDIRSTPS